MKKICSKKGNEILQTIIVIAVLGGLAVTVCFLINNKFKASSKAQLNAVDNSLVSGVTEAEKDRDVFK